MNTTYYLIKVEDCPTYDDKIRVTLYQTQEPRVLGARLCSASVPSEKHIGSGVKTVFATQFGNPDDKPPLRKVAAHEDETPGNYGQLPDFDPNIEREAVPLDESMDKMNRFLRNLGDGHPSIRDFDDYQGV